MKSRPGKTFCLKHRTVAQKRCKSYAFAQPFHANQLLQRISVKVDKFKIRLVVDSLHQLGVGPILIALPGQHRRRIEGRFSGQERYVPGVAVLLQGCPVERVL